MSLARQIDAYCERTGPEFWSEPLNAVTNAAFIVAGLAALAIAWRRGRLDPQIVYLSALIVIIGVGSFLFHTFATAWAAMLDTGPIALFILSWFAVAMHRLAGLGWTRALLATLALLAAMLALGWALRPLLGPVLGSSTGYVPPLLGLLAVGAWLRLRDRPEDRAPAAAVFLAAVVFALSLTFRTLDQPLCEAWPAGTHFLWHLLNAVVLGLTVLTLILHLPRRAP